MAKIIKIEQQLKPLRPEVHHIHNRNTKKAVLNRLCKSIGHYEAVRKMVELDADNTQILIQLAAVKSEINGISRAILQDHFAHCLVKAVREKDNESIDSLNETIRQLLK